MRVYRVYRVDGVGSFESADWIEAECDSTALELAGEMAGGSCCEVWERGRFVGAVHRGALPQTRFS